jgi:hypothetical protein
MEHYAGSKRSPQEPLPAATMLILAPVVYFLTPHERNS